MKKRKIIKVLVLDTGYGTYGYADRCVNGKGRGSKGHDRTVGGSSHKRYSRLF